jgi:hypothetical protein
MGRVLVPTRIGKGESRAWVSPGDAVLAARCATSASVSRIGLPYRASTLGDYPCCSVATQGPWAGEDRGARPRSHMPETASRPSCRPGSALRPFSQILSSSILK